MLRSVFSSFKIAFATLLCFLRAIAAAQETPAYEQAPFNYSKATPNDGIRAVLKRIASGAIKLGGDDRKDIQTFLHELKIPQETQLLVFSKTSFQRHRINPDHPRALYFNDRFYLGWVPSGLIELIAIDPVLGPMFYSFDPEVAQTNAAASLVRDNDCLRCHGGNFVDGIPGVFARSLFADQDGEPILRFGSEVVDFRTPFTNRWGGWYVTGTSGRTLHRGNVFSSTQGDKLVVDFTRGVNITNLSDFFNVKRYLEESSDIVALLVFEQQLTVQNALTRASIDSRRMLEYQKGLQMAFKTPVTREPAYDSVKSVFDTAARDLVNALLFKGEASLPLDLKGSAAFQKAFVGEAPKSRDGESLKDFDLHGHLFKNRCSYLIYSDSFRALPEALKHRVYLRLARALAMDKPDPDYAYLGAEERSRILSILRDTNPALSTALDAAASEIKEKGSPEGS
ncbi:MAG TPA: hypothetical protein VHH88_05540 [Verrucomicrobiae bacterium]|nr:hypothetical protein [Verrucomicrobiae bacterium]